MNRESGSQDSSGFSLVSDACRAPRPAAGALAVSEHRVAYVGAVAGEGDLGLPFSSVRPRATTDMSSVAMFLRTIGRLDWASDLPGSAERTSTPTRRGIPSPLLPVGRCAVPG